MGADIHFVVEYKNPKTNRWIGVFDTDNIFINSYNNSENPLKKLRGRDYEFFARLAGVRGEGPEPNGIPQDISELTAMLIEDWKSDGHSHSHRPLEEFIALKLGISEAEIIANKLTNARNELRHFFGPLHAVSDIHRYRVVFWFDN